MHCGSIAATGDVHPSPAGAVLQQAREPKPAEGERRATSGSRSPKFGMHPFDPGGGEGDRGGWRDGLRGEGADAGLDPVGDDQRLVHAEQCGQLGLVGLELVPGGPDGGVLVGRVF